MKVCTKQVEWGLILLLFLASLGLRVWIVAPTGFNGLYGQDAFAYYDFAGQLRQLPQGGQLSTNFFWPLGYPVLLVAGFAVFGTQALVGQMLSMILGAALTPMVYILTRQLGSKRSGALLAAWIMTLCGQALQSSLVLMSDIPALAWAALSAICLLHYLNRSVQAPAEAEDMGLKPLVHSRKLLWLVLSAGLLALACITRWLYLALIVPWGLAVLVTWGWKLQRWREVAIASLAAGLVFLPEMVYSRTAPVSPFDHAWVEGWSPANAFHSSFDNVDGHFAYAEINGIYYAQPFYDPYYLAPLFTPFLLIGIAGLVKHRRTLALALLLGWALLPFLFLAGIPYQNIRFPLIVVPAVAALVGIGFDAVVSWVYTQSFRLRYTALLALAGIVVLGSAHMLLVGHGIIGTFISNQQHDREAAEWTAQNVPAGATIYTFGLTLTLQHYSSLNVYELYYETPQTLRKRWVRGQDDYLLINVWNIETQWIGRDPQSDYHWLRDVRGLERLGRSGNYTLYRIDG